MRLPLVCLLALASGLRADPIHVSGKADPYLAGTLAGATASGHTPADPGVDSAPLNAPVLVPVSGGELYVSGVTGQVGHGPDPAKVSGPDGKLYNGAFVHHLAGPQNGLADAWVPINSLVGVFLADGPSLSAPGALDFRPGGNALGGTDYGLLHPQIGQVFFLGDGRVGPFTQFVNVPAGATRLYLGVADGWDWRDNQGGYDLTINRTQTPEPGSLLLLALGAVGVGGYAARRRG